MIDGKTPPDVVLDATQTGDATDAIKSLTKSQCYKTFSAVSIGGSLWPMLYNIFRRNYATVGVTSVKIAVKYADRSVNYVRNSFITLTPLVDFINILPQ